MQIAVTAASPNTVSTDLANAGVVLFSGAAALTDGTAYALGATQAAPASGSGGWLNVTSAAATGTLFKFVRRGIYYGKMSVVGTTSSALTWQIGMTLDCAAALCVIGTSLITPATAGLIDYRTHVSGAAAASGIPLEVNGEIYITDALAAATAAALPTAVAGTFSGGLGVLRFHSTNGANGAATTQSVVADTRASIKCTGDLAG